MRKRLATITVLIVFLTIQYGKFASYLYCKYQAELVQKLKDCGCESHLSEIFAGDEDHQTSLAIIKLPVTEFLSTQHEPLSVLCFSSSNSYFAVYKSQLLNRAIAPSFRPPSA
ncbi:MAG: hypothetical protein H7Y31_10710 [Chitinophagaceae bacterium]|nr:hypothetical protein [Chitinophagaceae bacterium]